MSDPINPDHYRSHPSGVECITIVEHLAYNLGAAIKYIWRAGLKSDDPVEDLRKSIWHLEREIRRLSIRSKVQHPSVDISTPEKRAAVSAQERAAGKL